MPVAVLGAKALLAVMLLVAGGAKLADLDSFAASVRLFLPARLTGAARPGGAARPTRAARLNRLNRPTRLVRPSSSLAGESRPLSSRAGARRIAWAVAVAELALGGASLAFPAVWPLGLAVLAAAACFAVVSGLGFAFHRGRSCRCFGALSRRKFDRSGLARAAAVAALAALATVGAPPSAVTLTPAVHAGLLAGSACIAFIAYTAARSLAASRDALPGMVS
jgi:hypothetical protein